MKTYENKSSFFIIQLEGETERIKEETDITMDLILSAMNVGNIFYKFRQKATKQLYYCFQTEKRKRRGQLIKLAEKLLPEEQRYDVIRLTKNKFYQTVNDMKQSFNFIKLEDPIDESNQYTGKDIKIFDNKKI